MLQNFTRLAVGGVTVKPILTHRIVEKRLENELSEVWPAQM
jgi:hypothetical protein